MTKLISLFLLLCTLSICAQQQHLPDSLKERELSKAFYNIRQLSCLSCQSEAYSVFLNYAKSGDVQSMYQLYQCLENGWGVTKNPFEAVEWLEKAAQANFEMAYIRLIDIYKKGLYNISCDLEKACQYAQRLAELDNPIGHYQYGYFLYKGLGCDQCYEKSMKYFAQGAMKNHGPSMYVLGLGYRNGYGLTVDINKARDLLSKAADKGVQAAIQELQSPVGENQLVKRNSGDTSDILPNTYKTVLNRLTNEIIGTYSGKLITYDWSGKHIIESNDLLMNIYIADNKVKIHWLIGSKEIVTLSKLADDSLIFDNVTYQKSDRYNSNKLQQCQFISATFDSKQIDGKSYLHGNLQEYFPELKEKERPMYFIVEKKSDIAFQEDFKKITNLQVTPNLFYDTFNVSFTVTQSGIAHISFYSLKGMVIMSKSLGYLDEGEYSFDFTPDAEVGTYFIRLSYNGKEYLTKTITKTN